ncbi:MAG: hypothetical protein ABR597_10430 [Bacteroidales bacterium]
MKNDDINKELKELAPGLEKLQGNNPFTVPQDYFESLPQQINERIHAPVSEKRPVFELFTLPKLALVVSSFLLIVFAGYIAYVNYPSEPMLSEAEQEVYDQHLAWYSNYQPNAYYDIILESEQEVVTDDFEYTEEEVVEYLLTYTDYYLDYIPDADNNNQ